MKIWKKLEEINFFALEKQIAFGEPRLQLRLCKNAGIFQSFLVF